MSYEKLGFEKGQVLKAEHLNHMEEGIENAAGGATFFYVGNNYIYHMDANTGAIGEAVTQSEFISAVTSGAVYFSIATVTEGFASRSFIHANHIDFGGKYEGAYAEVTLVLDNDGDTVVNYYCTSEYQEGGK